MEIARKERDAGNSGHFYSMGIETRRKKRDI